VETNSQPGMGPKWGVSGIVAIATQPYSAHRMPHGFLHWHAENGWDADFTMKIKLEGGWVCSICGSIWGKGDPYHCESCGAWSQMEDLPLTEWNWDSSCVEDDYSEDSTPIVEGNDFVGDDETP